AFRKLSLVDVVNLVGDMEVHEAELVGKRLGQDVIAAKTGEIIASQGDVITDEQAKAILAAAEQIGKVHLQRESPQECVVVKGEKGEKEYLIPEGATMRVNEGDHVNAGDQLIE